MSLVYRVVTTDVPEGALWVSREVSRHLTYEKARAVCLAGRAKGQPAEVQIRLFASEPWQWVKVSEGVTP